MRSDEMETDAHGGQNLMSGPRYCYEGEHTKARLAKGDARRVQPFTVHITQSSSLQAEIDAVPKDTVCLVVTNAIGNKEQDGEKWTFEDVVSYMKRFKL